MIHGRNISVQEALSRMVAGEMVTIPQLCKSTPEPWLVQENDFTGVLGPNDPDGFLNSGLPFYVVDFGDRSEILINPSEFDEFMQVYCGEESA